MAGQYEFEPQPEGRQPLGLFGESGEPDFPTVDHRLIILNGRGAQTDVSDLNDDAAAIMASTLFLRQVQLAFSEISRLHGWQAPEVEPITGDNYEALLEHYKYAVSPGAVFPPTSGHIITIPDVATLVLTIESVTIVRGSIRTTLKAMLAFIDSPGVFNTVLATIIASNLLTSCTINPVPVPYEGEMYNCVIAESVQLDGNLDNYIYSAAGDLIDNPAYGEGELKRLWRSRQSCLAALGLYTGEVDGINGRYTQAAITAFENQYGLTVDWTSRAFAEVLIRRAMTARAQEASR